MTAPKPNRRFLRFSLRTFLLAVLAVCVALGWKVEQARKQRAVVTWVHEMGGSVHYYYQFDDDGDPIPYVEPPAPKWLIEMLGIDFFDDVFFVDLKDVMQVSDVTALSALPNLKKLYLSNNQIKDVTPLSGLMKLDTLDLGSNPVKDVTSLSGLRSLEQLWLQRTQVSDVTLLAGLTKLRTLRLDRTQVSDLTPLAGLTSLEQLWLRDTPVSDVTPLSGLTKLHTVLLLGTHVSREAVENLKRALPQCGIAH